MVIFSNGNPLIEKASKYAAELQRPTLASLSGEGSGEGRRGKGFPVDRRRPKPRIAVSDKIGS